MLGQGIDLLDEISFIGLPLEMCVLLKNMKSSTAKKERTTGDNHINEVSSLVLLNLQKLS
jgi:hypothetical protein